MAISFSCPKCKKVLKTANPIPAGKNVKCSSCSTVFPMPATQEEDTGIQARPAPAAARRTAPPPARDDEDDEHRRRPAARRDGYEDDDDVDERPRRSARADGDEDDDDYDERPARRHKKSGKLGLILGIAGGVLALLLLVGGFVWPGFFKGGGGGGAANPLLAFAPANAEVVMGADLTSIRSKPANKQKIEQALAQAGAPAGVADMVFNAESGIVAMHIGDGIQDPKVLIAVSSSKVIDVETARQAIKAGPPEMVQGKSIYKGQNAGRGQVVMSFPDPKTAVFSNLGDADFIQVLNKSNKLPADVLAQVDIVGRSQVWGVVNLRNPAIQRGLQSIPAQQVPLPGVGDALDAVKRGKFALVAIDQPAGARFQLGLECSEGNDAAKLEPALRNLWDQAKPFLQIAKMGVGQQPGMQGAGLMIDDVARTLTISRRGNAVFATVDFSENTVKAMENMQNMQFPGGF